MCALFVSRPDGVHKQASRHRPCNDARRTRPLVRCGCSPAEARCPSGDGETASPRSITHGSSEKNFILLGIALLWERQAFIPAVHLRMSWGHPPPTTVTSLSSDDQTSHGRLNNWKCRLHSLFATQICIIFPPRYWTPLGTRLRPKSW